MIVARKYPVIIGIAGGTGAGKTTICNQICQHSQIDITVLNHDSYYKCLKHLPEDERAQYNFDKPEAFDNDLLYESLRRLKNGQSANAPEYNFVTHTRTGKIKTVCPTELILVEGILLFENPEIRSCFDYKIYVDLEPDIRFIRRLTRDIKDRGRTVNSVVKQYLTSVRPMHNEHVEPTRAYADIVINGLCTATAVSQVINHIDSIFLKLNNVS